MTDPSHALTGLDPMLHVPTASDNEDPFIAKPIASKHRSLSAGKYHVNKKS